MTNEARPHPDISDLQDALTDDLRKPQYRGHPNRLTGHCYVACEALYHHVGGRSAGWKPCSIQHEGGPHWFLRDAQGLVVDPTAGQFTTPVPYDQGVGRGFLTKGPSKRAQRLMDSIGW